MKYIPESLALNITLTKCLESNSRPLSLMSISAGDAHIEHVANKVSKTVDIINRLICSLLAIALKSLLLSHPI